MSCVTSSTTMNRTARSSRQSGLKKPRPLRSVSLQETTDYKDVKKIVTGRQLSHPSSEVESPSTEDNFPVCEGISAMSAMIVAQAESESKDTHNSEDQSVESQRQIFNRQNSSSSFHSCIESDSGSSFSRQNSSPSEDGTLTSHSVSAHQDNRVSNATIQRRSFSRSFSNNSVNNNNKQIPLDMNSNHVSYNQNNDSLCLSRNDNDFGNVPFVTLLTAQGEEIILSGKRMKTLLGAAKILVREMGASIISLRIEDLNEDDISPPETPSESFSSPKPDEHVQESQKEVIRYSKEELLALSECDYARNPPANWNILVHTHSDCCLPHSKMKEYFEAIDFHRHDGTLVMEDRRVRERKEKMPF